MSDQRTTLDRRGRKPPPPGCGARFGELRAFFGSEGERTSIYRWCLDLGIPKTTARTWECDDRFPGHARLAEVLGNLQTVQVTKISPDELADYVERGRWKDGSTASVREALALYEPRVRSIMHQVQRAERDANPDDRIDPRRQPEQGTASPERQKTTIISEGGPLRVAQPVARPALASRFVLLAQTAGLLRSARERSSDPFVQAALDEALELLPRLDSQGFDDRAAQLPRQDSNLKLDAPPEEPSEPPALTILPGGSPRRFLHAWRRPRETDGSVSKPCAIGDARRRRPG